MKRRMIALFGAVAMLLVFFTACGTKPPVSVTQNDPQLVVALNPTLVYDDGTTVNAYNDMNKAMGADSQSSTLSAIADSPWAWGYSDDNGWTERAVYGFGRWMSGTGKLAKGVFAYRFNQAGNTSLGVYDVQSNEMTTYQDDALPEAGMLLTAVAGSEEGLAYIAPQTGVMSLPAGTITAVEQVAGVKTGFLAEDGTPRSACVRILFNGDQLWSGTLMNSTAAEDGVAVTQLSYPQFDNLPADEGSALLFTLELNAEANRDEDITMPTVNEEDNWQVVKASRTVLKDNTLEESDITTDDGSIKTIMSYQFTFTLVRDAKYTKMVTEFATDIMRRTAAEVFTGREGRESEYEIVIGVMAERPESKKIYDEIISARADNAGDYVIRLVGTKLYIVGANDDALQTALQYFLDTFVKDDQGKIPAKYNYYYHPAHKVYTLAGQNIASYTIRTEYYPSLVVQRAAEAVQKAVLDDCGYVIPIKALNSKGTDAGNNEIRIGPMNGAVKVQRQYDTRFNHTDWQQFMSIDSDGMLAGDDGAWRVKFSGKNVVVEGGEAYSVNVGTMTFIADLRKSGALATSYAASGVYKSYYDYAMMGKYDTVDYAMSDGFGLTYSEDFSYTGTDEEKEKTVRSKWNWDTQPNNPEANDKDQEMYCYMPDVYGTNWWVAADTAGNSYLFEITKKRTMEHEGSDFGYEGQRMTAEGKWGFRYGLWETRLIMGTRNGTSSSIWAVTDPPYERIGPYCEIDVYENYGREAFVPCTHHNQDKVYIGNYHFQAPYYQEACWEVPREGEHYYDTFHHIAVDWSYDYINFYLDGECVSRMPMTDYEHFKYYRTGMVVKFWHGVMSKFYCNMNEKGEHGKLPAYVPSYFMDDVSKFFELQLVDYTRLHQVNNDTVELKQAESEMKFLSTFGKVR